MRYTTRPLSDRTWFRPQSKRVGTRFSSKWPDTLKLLYREVEALTGKNLVIEVDIQEADLRLDGAIRAASRAASPAVIVSFDSKHGPLTYRCDRFVAQFYGQPDDWQQNVRAIALTLESLRAVDRYGATESGQQYTGWKAIGTAPAKVNESSLQVMERLAGVTVDEAGGAARVIALARRAAHPDRGGSTEAWDQWSAAYRSQIQSVVKS